MLRTGTDAYSGVLDHRGIRSADDIVVMPLQSGTQWDGLGHVFYENSMWNGYDCREVTTAGAQKCGVGKRLRTATRLRETTWTGPLLRTRSRYGEATMWSCEPARWSRSLPPAAG